MIRCLPKGLCSWSYYLDGEGRRASIDLNTFGEQGGIFVDSVHYQVHKHGLFSGHWSLNQNGKVIATAQKLTPFTRTFDLEGVDGPMTMRAISAFSRSFRIEQYGERLATIAPVHAFTRRATIERAPKADIPTFPTMAFCFWLAAQIWRRQQQSNAAAT